MLGASKAQITAGKPWDVTNGPGSAPGSRGAHDVCLSGYTTQPGTPAMAAVWIILGKTRFPAEFIESSAQLKWVGEKEVS